MKLKGQRFTNLQSDPCTYIREADNHIEITMAWVNDLASVYM